MATAPLADFIAFVGLLALGRVILALAALDTGTALGGIGASRAIDLAVFAAPALLLVVVALALLAGSTNLDAIVAALQAGSVGPRLALGFALAALVPVALADAGRAPLIDPATPLEAAMGPAAMGVDYSGRHLALVEWASALRLLLWVSLLAALAVPGGMATPDDGILLTARPAGLALQARCVGGGAGVAGIRPRRAAARPGAGTARPRRRARPARPDLPSRRPGDGVMADLAHLFGGAVLVLSFALLAQRRLAAMVLSFAAQSVALAGAVACQAWLQRSPALGLVALAVAGINAAAVPTGLARLVAAVPAGQPVRNALGTWARLAAAMALAAFSVLAVLPAATIQALDRESLALALATALLGPLVMLARRGLPTQAIGFLATENGLLLAVAAARGMPFAATLSLLLLAAGGAVVTGLAGRRRGAAR